MYRTIWIFGACLLAFVTVLLAALFAVRLVSDEPWRFSNVFSIVLFTVAVVAFLAVYLGRGQRTESRV